MKKEFDLMILNAWLATIPVGRAFGNDVQEICDRIFRLIIGNYYTFEKKMKIEKPSASKVYLKEMIKDSDELSLLYRNKQIDEKDPAIVSEIFEDIAQKRIFDYNTTRRSGEIMPDFDKLARCFYKHAFGEKSGMEADVLALFVFWMATFVAFSKTYFEIVKKYRI
jgi:hypothetical protein